MKPKLLLRIAAVLMLVHTGGHTVGALTWNKAPNTAVGNVISSMQTNQFEFMGRETSIAMFYQGYGISMIFVLLFISVLLWMLGSGNNRQIILLTAGFLAVLAVSEYIYFFLLATAFTAVSALCCFFAGVKIKAGSTP